MRPKSAHFYLDEIQEVADEFMDFIKNQKSDDSTMINCLPEIYRYTFESICLISLDARIGCLNVPMDPEIARTFKASQRLLGEDKSVSLFQPTCLSILQIILQCFIILVTLEALSMCYHSYGVTAKHVHSTVLTDSNLMLVYIVLDKWGIFDPTKNALKSAVMLFTKQKSFFSISGYSNETLHSCSSRGCKRSGGALSWM